VEEAALALKTKMPLLAPKTLMPLLLVA